MGSLYFYIKDLDGNPIQNAEVSATMSQEPCGLLAVGCSSGPDYTESGYTDANGEWIGDIKYTKAPTISYSVQATGYYSQTGTTSLNGANLINENVWGTINVSMTPVPSSSNPGSTAPPGQGTGAVTLQQLETDLTSGNYELQQGGMIAAIEIPIVIAVVAIAVIAIGLIMWRLSA